MFDRSGVSRSPDLSSAPCLPPQIRDGCGQGARLPASSYQLPARRL